MREALAALEGTRIVVQGTYRKSSAWPLAWARQGRAVLLGGVATPSGELLADHLWIPHSRAMAGMGLKGGMAVELRGTVALYTRADGSEDYSLVNVRQARRLEAQSALPEKDIMSSLRHRTQKGRSAAQRVEELLLHIQRSVALPLPSSPHCAPTSTMAGM